MKDKFNNFIDQLSPNKHLMLILLNTVVFVCLCFILVNINFVSQEFALIIIKSYLLIISSILVFALIFINKFRNK